jgi:hypothetical protein
MPTAAKLVSAVVFAALAFLVADLYVPGMAGSPAVGFLREGCALIGLLCGWLVMGRLVGKGMYAAVGSGFRTSATILFWCLLSFSIYEMVKNSTKKIYDGPMEALLAIFDIMVKYGKFALTPEVLGTLAVGGILGGMLAEWISRRAS